jgi:hypothetical protein
LPVGAAPPVVVEVEGRVDVEVDGAELDETELDDAGEPGMHWERDVCKGLFKIGKPSTDLRVVGVRVCAGAARSTHGGTRITRTTACSAVSALGRYERSWTRTLSPNGDLAHHLAKQNDERDSGAQAVHGDPFECSEEEATRVVFWSLIETTHEVLCTKKCREVDHLTIPLHVFHEVRARL